VVLIDDTIILRGVFFLWIVGKPYALGRSESLDLNLNISVLEIYSSLYQFLTISLSFLSIDGEGSFINNSICVDVFQCFFHFVNVQGVPKRSGHLNISEI